MSVPALALGARPFRTRDEAARQAADANAVRTLLPTCVAPHRHVLVHLTSFAPGCAHLGVGDPTRWRQFWSTEPARVLRSLLKRLDRSPHAVELEPQPNGDIALLGDADPTVPDAEDEAPGLAAPVLRAPLAFVCSGATLPELTAALAQLRAPQTPAVVPLHAPSGDLLP